MNANVKMEFIRLTETHVPALTEMPAPTQKMIFLNLPAAIALAMPSMSSDSSTPPSVFLASVDAVAVALGAAAVAAALVGDEDAILGGGRTTTRKKKFDI